ncbi:hypothetical protein C8Q74DRAFT_1267964 [Fomes fomentarius]|nr:hypothetical protein C8Q74DRAFT_1267964 [Fomes fomentarius]
MEDMDEEGMDVETLQAQIDMSMAFTHNLVSGWMQTSKAKLPSSRTYDGFELEEYMRRPPRLGVGASVPESTGILSRETAKLRNKLVGNNKKRAREDDETNGPRPAPQAIVISDDDEDSRARVIAKKARVDPFAPKTKEKKKGKTDTPQALASTPVISPSKKTVGVPRDEPAPGTAASTAHTAASVESDHDAVSSTSKKRKKKKKHNTHAAGGAAREGFGSALTSSSPQGATASTKAEVIDITQSPSRNFSSPAIKPAAAMAVGTSTSRSISNTGATQSTTSNTPSTPARAPTIAPQSSPQRLDPFGMPLLNLSGPPPDVGDAETNSPKKKRKKKKKKKKGVAEPSANTDVIDVDGDDDD